MTEVSPTFCAFPWMHLHAWPEGKAMLCCIAHGGKNDGEVGDFSKNTYAEIMNSDELKTIRLKMLAGEKVEQCVACYHNEEVLRRPSFRQGTLETYGDLIPSLIENTNLDGSITDPVMYYMDFRFSNLCNLGCRTCGSPLSSTIANWRGDSREITFLNNKGVLSERGTITSFVYARPDFLDVDVFPYIHDVRGFYFAGGEPMMHYEHFAILDKLNQNKLYNKMIIYSTNLTVLTWKDVNFLDIWKNFNNIQFNCSIDGYEEKLEFIRNNSKNKNVFNNLHKLIQFKKDNPRKRFKINICYTHSIYNAYYTREFFEYLEHQGILDDLDDIIFNHAFGDENSPAMLPEFAKNELRQKRKDDLSMPIMEKVFTKFPQIKHDFSLIHEILDNQVDFSFDRFVDKLYKDPRNTVKTSLPWLGNVIDRYFTEKKK